MPDGFPIAPRWIPPTPTASLTATVCLEASESAEIAPVRMHSWNDGMLPGIRWVRWGGRGDELRLRRTGSRPWVTRDRPDSRDRWRKTDIGQPSPVASRWTLGARVVPFLCLPASALTSRLDRRTLRKVEGAPIQSAG